MLDPNNKIITTAFGTTYGAVANIASTVLPTEGIYSLVVSAPPNLSDTGHYVVTASDTTPNPRDTAIVIQSDRVAGMAYGNSVTFTAIVKPLAATGPNATGTAQFRVDGVNAGLPVPLVNQMASIAIPSLNAGIRKVTILYSGDGSNYDPKSSSEFTQIVSKVPLLTISPLDVLLIINQLNSFGGGQLSLPWTGKYIDTDGDDSVSPLDVLTVINFLNGRSSGSAEGGLLQIDSRGIYFDEAENKRRRSIDSFFEAFADELEQVACFAITSEDK